jgi:hypothetical protein
MKTNKMKKQNYLIIFMLFIVASVFAQNEFSFYGTNEFLFIYRSMDDDYQSQFDDDSKINVENRLQFRSLYKNWQAGLKFNALHPKYEPFASTPGDIHDEENEYFFEEFYLQYEGMSAILRAGTFDAVIGSGMALHTYYDRDVDEDASLRGGYFSYFNDFINSKLFFGIMKPESENYREEGEFDQVGAADIEIAFTDFLKIGTAYALHRQNQSLTANVDEDYLQRQIMSGRINFNIDLLELNSEYAYSNDDNEQSGNAFYTSISAYLGKFSLLSAYKNYRDFNFYISDLPTVNHSEEPLHLSTEPGFDEEGLLGEIRFIPNYENEFTISAAEAWNSDKSLKMADYFISYKREFSFGNITAEHSHLEQWQKDTNWLKELTPHLAFEYYHDVVPVTLKLEYIMKEEANRAETKSHDEPKIQLDLSYQNYSVSFIGMTQVGDSFNANDGDIWLGMEVAAYLFENTDIRLFYGKEKAGKVCRNGVCKFQPEFDGARLLITTTF